MPMVIPHSPVGIETALSTIEPNTQYAEEQTRQQEVNQSGANQRAELAERTKEEQDQLLLKRQENQQSAVSTANELAQRAHEFQVNSALKGQEINAVQAQRMAQMAMQQDRQNDLNEYRRGQLENRASGLLDRENSESRLEQYREQALAAHGQQYKDEADRAAKSQVFKTNQAAFRQILSMKAAALQKAHAAALAASTDPTDKEGQTAANNELATAQKEYDAWMARQSDVSAGGSLLRPPTMAEVTALAAKHGADFESARGEAEGLGIDFTQQPSDMPAPTAPAGAAPGKPTTQPVQDSQSSDTQGP
jgi:hypothetical protein